MKKISDIIDNEIKDGGGATLMQIFDSLESWKVSDEKKWHQIHVVLAAHFMVGDVYVHHLDGVTFYSFAPF